MKGVNGSWSLTVFAKNPLLGCLSSICTSGVFEIFVNCFNWFYKLILILTFSSFFQVNLLFFLSSNYSVSKYFLIIFVFNSPLKIRKIRNITDFKKMPPWVINTNLTFIQKALKVSINIYTCTYTYTCITCTYIYIYTYIHIYI